MNPFSLVQKPTEITAADNFRVNMLAIHKLKKITFWWTWEW